MKNNWPILVSAILVSASILISPHFAPPSTESEQSIPISISQFSDQVKSQIVECTGVDVEVHMAPYRISDDIYVAKLSYISAQGHHFTRVHFTHNGVGQYTGKIMGEFLGQADDIPILVDCVTFR